MGAARVVNLSQPALSKSIQALEQEYGVQLFVRHARGLVPTPHGLALEHHARRILLDIEQSRRDLNAISSGAVGRVRIGVGEAFVKFVEDALVELEFEFTGADMTVITDYAEGLRTALLENRIDMFLGMVNRLVDEPEFDTEIVASDAIVGLCHKTHPFSGQTVSLDQLRGNEWLVPERGEIARSALEAFCLLNREPLPRFKVVTNVSRVVGRFVRDFQLLSIAPVQNLEQYSEFELACFWIRDFDYQRQIGMVQRADVAPNPLTKAFRAKLRSVLGAAKKERRYA